MAQSSQPSRSPTAGLLSGLVLTLAAVLLFAYYMTGQLTGLRALQSNLVDRNRKDSLQLLRVQNDLNSLALAMRDMLDEREPYPLTAWTAQFERIREDLAAALNIEDTFAPAQRTADQRTQLSQSLAQFWDATDRMFALAADGKEKEARDQIQVTLQARQAALSTAVSRFLVQNNEAEAQATAEITGIYDRVQRQLYFFLSAALLVIVLTSLYLIRANRIIFAQIEALSEQRSELAQKLISTQESTLRHLSRELHDEFGQVLTAIGSLLSRAGKKMPDDTVLREDLKEVQEITQSTLTKVRGLSQALHPVLLDEAGLEATLDWYIPTVERQTGIVVHNPRLALHGRNIPIQCRLKPRFIQQHRMQRLRQPAHFRQRGLRDLLHFLQILPQYRIVWHFFALAAQQRPDRRQHLPKFIVQFARKMPQRGFLRRNQFLRQLAALCGERFQLRKNLFVCLNQIQTCQHNYQQRRPQKQIELPLHAIVNFPNLRRCLLFAFVILNQQPRYCRAQRRLPRLQRHLNLFPRFLFFSICCQRKHPVHRIPELRQRS